MTLKRFHTHAHIITNTSADSTVTCSRCNAFASAGSAYDAMELIDQQPCALARVDDNGNITPMPDAENVTSLC